MSREKRRVETPNPWSTRQGTGRMSVCCTNAQALLQPAARNTAEGLREILSLYRRSLAGGAAKAPTPLLRSLSKSHYPVCFLHPTDVVPKSSSRLPHEHPHLRNCFQGNERKTSPSFITAMSACVTATGVLREE